MVSEAQKRAIIKWRKNHIEQFRAYQREYMKKYYAEKVDGNRTRGKKYYLEHRDDILAKRRERYRKKKEAEKE